MSHSSPVFRKAWITKGGGLCSHRMQYGASQNKGGQSVMFTNPTFQPLIPEDNVVGEKAEQGSQRTVVHIPRTKADEEAMVQVRAAEAPSRATYKRKRFCRLSRLNYVSEIAQTPRVQEFYPKAKRASILTRISYEYWIVMFLVGASAVVTGWTEPMDSEEVALHTFVVW